MKGEAGEKREREFVGSQILEQLAGRATRARNTQKD